MRIHTHRQGAGRPATKSRIRRRDTGWHFIWQIHVFLKTDILSGNLLNISIWKTVPKSSKLQLEDWSKTRPQNPTPMAAFRAGNASGRRFLANQSDCIKYFSAGMIESKSSKETKFRNSARWLRRRTTFPKAKNWNFDFSPTLLWQERDLKCPTNRNVAGTSPVKSRIEANRCEFSF